MKGLTHTGATGVQVPWSGWKVFHRTCPVKASAFWCLRRHKCTIISLKCSSGSRPKINEGIFTEFSTGLLVHAVFEIITPFWKTVRNRKVYFFWNSSNSAETVRIDGTKTKSYLLFMKSSIQLTLHTSLWESVKMAIHVQKWLNTHHPAGSCTRVQQPVNSQVPFNISKKWSNIYFIGPEGK